MGLLDPPALTPSAAATMFAPGTLSSDQWVPLGYRARTPFNSTGSVIGTIQSNGVNLGTTFRMEEVAQLSGRDICVEFNLFLNGEVEVGNDVTINRCVISTESGLNIPFLFNGSPSVTVKSGTFGAGRVRSDPLGVSIKKGDVYVIMVNVSVASGGKYPLSVLARRGSYSEGAAQGGAESAGPGPDYTGDGTTFTADTAVVRMFMPSAVLVRPSKPSRVPLFVTDSIGAGVGEETASLRARWDEGWCTRAVRDKWPHYVCAMSGTTVDRWTSNNQRYSFRRRSTIAGIYYTDLICELGINDFFAGANLATVQTRWIAAWKSMALHGRPVYQTTITPSSATSTDSFVTVANQTPHSNAAAVAAGNTWLRDGAPINTTTGTAAAVGATGADIVRAPSYLSTTAGAAVRETKTTQPGHPLTGILEVSDAVEATRGSGKWKVLNGARDVSDGAMTSGSTTLTSATAAFTASDVGRLVRVFGAGTAGANLGTSITAYNSPTSVTVNTAAGTTVSEARVLVSHSGIVSDGIHPSGTAGPEPGGHEAIANYVRPQLAMILGGESA